MTDYQKKFPYKSIQHALDRLALLEWFNKEGEASKEEVSEMHKIHSILWDDYKMVRDKGTASRRLLTLCTDNEDQSA